MLPSRRSRSEAGQLLTDVMELPGVGRWVQVEGPGGEEFGLMEPTRD